MKTTTTKLTFLQLDAINIGTSNPRKEFKDDTLIELCQSIKDKGVLQSLLVRPFEGSYQLVCGERRYRASLMAGLLEVPVQIREMKDQEVMEVQLIENLEREDVHPLFEAQAFKFLMDTADYTTSDIAKKIVKSETFIIQRLSLLSLITVWRKAFLKNGINLSKALIISRLTKEDQKEVAENAMDFAGGVKSAKSLQNYIDKNIVNLLANASFDIEDSVLVKKCGACSLCPKRSGGISSLFADIKENDRCFDKACFKTKTDKHLNNEIQKIINEGENVFFIKTRWENCDESIVQQINQMEIKILERYEDFDIYNGKDKRKKRVQGLWVSGNEIGKTASIVLIKTKDIEKEAKEVTVVGQIEKIEQRAIRALELDQEKIQKKVSEKIGESAEFLEIDKLSTTPTDIVLRNLLLWNLIAWHQKDEVGLIIQIDKYNKQGNKGVLKRLGELTEQEVTFMVRNISYKAYANVLPTFTEGIALRKMANTFTSIDIKAIEKEQKSSADKRILRTEERIEKLKKSSKN